MLVIAAFTGPLNQRVTPVMSLPTEFSSDATTPPPSDLGLPTFTSCQELNGALRPPIIDKSVLSQIESEASGETSADESAQFFSGPQSGSQARESVPKAATGSLDSYPRASVRYTRTNVQVKGVDEADIVKTDGQYLYVYSKPNSHITIALAQPAQQLSVVSTIPYPDANIHELFLDGNRLTIFGKRSGQNIYNSTTLDSIGPNVRRIKRLPTNETFVDVWNIQNRNLPELERSLGFEGDYLTSRLRAGIVYLALNSEAPLRLSKGGFLDEDLIPNYRDTATSPVARPLTRCDLVEYFSPKSSDSYFILAAIPLRQPTQSASTRLILGSGQSVYMSANSFYVAESRQPPTALPLIDSSIGVLPDATVFDRLNDVIAIPPSTDPATEIHKFILSGTRIIYAAHTVVPGTVLNQFSMDEYNNTFRIATTRGQTASDNRNALYIYDQHLKRLGTLDNLAPGEKIYSARFLGPRVYLVTFRQIDPLFVIDTSNPRAPRVLGQLKIPGFSQYLHPVDNNHIIGVGKHADQEGRELGIKLALFDVANVRQPKELDLVEIGGPGSDSEVLRDHKAFLFDRTKQLLVLPVNVLEPNSTDRFQGVYVFRVTPDGFHFRDRLSHATTRNEHSKANLAIRRSLYIDQALFTISNLRVAAHRLQNLSHIRSLDL